MSHEAFQALENAFGQEWRAKIADKDLRAAKAIRGFMNHCSLIWAILAMPILIGLDNNQKIFVFLIE